ncbi:exported hypothetical protein [Vibrio nigripulchritudo SOn1]|uniref:Uncharacterized protein n=1 Tax=Vibrio nigripulchritudo SOn1 TaxID=1238450 RepID=A0AAV2VVA0_9VIBR|nr:hypothetical protein [Vibrio nigripulchritudo]CCO48545.1 exported hypothetical protein [Vibrio nigripulchritudo SOn1]
MFKKIMLIGAMTLISNNALASGAGLEVKDIYYCGSDFSMKMSNGERWVVRKSQVGDQKLDHFLSIAMYMVASGKKTGNVFPGDPIEWCGNSNVRPIHIFGFRV